MGQPITSNVVISKELNLLRSEPGELKHLSTQRKRKQIVIPVVVASELGTAEKVIDRRIGWKPKPKRVKALYSKSIVFHIKYHGTREILWEDTGATP